MGRKPLPRRWSGRNARRAALGLAAAALWPFGGCSTKETQANGCAEVCTCVKNATADPNTEQSCLEQCGEATRAPVTDHLTACVKNLEDTGYPQCTSACLVFAPTPTDLGTCSGYRATSRTECRWDGQRVLQDDKACSENISPSLSGYCECEKGKVHIDCGHAEGTCFEACHNGYFGHFTSGAGGATGTGGRTGDASPGGNPGTGGTALIDGGDPCSGYLDSTIYTYACGVNLGADPDTLYLCNDGKTEGTVACPNGCAAAPPGQPNYCYGTDPCMNLPFNRVACGSNLANPAATQDSLYECSNGVTLSATPCASGCAPTAAAAADYCY